MPIPTHVSPRLRVDRAKARAATADAIPDATDAELDAALASIDQDALYDQERAGWTAEVWDRQSPINGVPAQHFLDRGDVPAEGDVYLVKQNGQVVMFQPHEPHVGGIVPVPVGKGLERGNLDADQIAADRTASEVARRVVEHVKAARGA